MPRWSWQEVCTSDFLIWWMSTLTWWRYTGRSVRLNLLSIMPRFIMFWRLLKRSPWSLLWCWNLICPRMSTLERFLSHRLSLNAGSSRKLALTWSVALKERSVHAIIMGMNSWVGRKPLLMMETSLPAGSRLNHKCPLALRRGGTLQTPLHLGGCLLSSIIAVLQLQPELTTVSSLPRRKLSCVGSLSHPTVLLLCFTTQCLKKARVFSVFALCNESDSYFFHSPFGWWFGWFVFGPHAGLGGMVFVSRVRE